VIGLLRRLRILPPTRLTSGEAMNLAIGECRRRGWAWGEPVHVKAGINFWEFLTNADYIGGNVIIRIDATTGAVRKAVFYSR
jgi:hypothetical protein